MKKFFKNSYGRIILIGSLIVTASLGIFFGIILNNKSASSKQKLAVPTSIPAKNIVPTGRIVSPTVFTLFEIVKKVDAQRIIIEGTQGEMVVSKNPDVVKIFRRSGGKLIPSTFQEIKVGQYVTLKIIKPGKEAELIIEK
ncbi:hypothetical protein FJY90_05610 [Candidatus Gottesmanbacteria bacterium]|nr:hypothetical protein [Candidatus Gottesmanbacteria bacterium]